MWGPSDPVFSDRYLADLMERLPHAQVHRFTGSGHLVHEHPRAPSVIFDWLANREERVSGSPPQSSAPLWSGIDRRSADDNVAVVELHGSERRHVTFRGLHEDMERIGAGLDAHGIKRGDRVALMIPPGLDLTAVLYACWRIGAVVVIADPGLGPKGMTQALRSARPDVLIGIPRAIRGAAALGWPGRRIGSIRMSGLERNLLTVGTDLPALRAAGAASDLPVPPEDGDLAAVVFTSGATGPAKGVIYRYHQACAQRDALMRLYDIRADDRLVAAFAPFALSVRAGHGDRLGRAGHGCDFAGLSHRSGAG